MNDSGVFITEGLPFNTALMNCLERIGRSVGDPKVFAENIAWLDVLMLNYSNEDETYIKEIEKIKASFSAAKKSPKNLDGEGNLPRSVAISLEYDKAWKLARVLISLIGRSGFLPEKGARGKVSIDLNKLMPEPKEEKDGK